MGTGTILKLVTVMATPDDVDTPGDARVTIKHSVSSVKAVKAGTTMLTRSMYRLP